jgi:pseudouridine synthase
MSADRRLRKKRLLKRRRESPPGEGVAGVRAEGERLQRVLADAGVASRRACEQMIRDGRVSVNDLVVTDLPCFVRAGDRILVDGRRVVRARGEQEGERGAGGGGERLIYLMVFKPPRVVTSMADEAGRVTIAELVRHPSETRVYPVGRLGFHASGLVLMTNDGDLANRLTHARYGVSRTYRVWARGEMSRQQVRELEQSLARMLRSAAYRKGLGARRFGGETPEPSRAGAPVKVELVDRAGITERAGESLEQGGRLGGLKTVIDVTLTGARDSRLDLLLAQGGCKAVRMMQVGLGPLRLSGVAVGQWRELRRGEVLALRRAAGLRGGGAGGGGGGGGAPRGEVGP